MSHHRALMIVGQLTSAAIAIGFSGGMALAQSTGAAPVEEMDVTALDEPEFRFVVSGAALYQFETNLSGGGDFSVIRTGAGLGMHVKFSNDFSGAFQIAYGLDLYDFSGTTLGLAADPWDDIHTISASAIFSHTITNDWSIFGGPVIQSARESGADFGDSIKGGGAIGATYHPTRDFTIGGGLVIMSEIEDGVRVAPILVIDWEFVNDVRLRNTSTSNAATRSGIELVWEPGDQWEVAFGGAWQYSRFRLDDDGPVPDGVGEDQSIPFWFRATYRPNRQFAIEGILGFNTNGELTLHNSSGSTLVSRNYDPAFFAGVFASFQF